MFSSTIIKLQSEILARYNDDIGNVEPDGQIKRFKNSATWVVGHAWEFKGKEYCSFQYGNWKFADGTYRVDSFDKKELKNKKFLKDFSKRMEEVHLKVENEKKEKNDKCRKVWLPKWKKADKETLHEYLIDKGLEESYGSRVDSSGVMLVPIYDENHFVGVQRIFLNPESEKYEKRFSSGIKIKGSFFPLKSFKNADYIYLSEGFATACTVQKAFPNVPSICIFNSGNIYPAIKSIRAINPGCKIIICADRDKESNTGEIFARKASQSFNSCIYKMPVFKNDNGRWTDFNDLHQFNSLKKVQDQLKFTISDFIVIEPLGVIDDRFYYMSSENPQPIKILGHNHTEKYLYNLVPDKFWWMKNFPKFDKDDENKEDPIGVDWVRAGTNLMKRGLKKGRYELSNVRSSGVWEDSGKYYYHNGFTLYDGKKEVDIFAGNLDKHYVMGKSCHALDKKQQLTEAERANLLEIFGTISTKTQQHGLLLLGWLVTAPIAGALPWRPHIWLTGESSQGKSWTMENIMGVVLNGFCIRPQGDSTEAGIRQAVGNQALPLIFDEFETDDIRTSNRTEGVISLARQASTPSDGDIMRGTTTGSAMTFSPNFAMCVAGINPNLSHKQDKNRWTVIEFSGDRASEEQFKKIQKISQQTLTSDFSRKMVSYVFHHIDVYIENFNTIESYLRAKKFKSHFCRQYASLLAGLVLILYPESVDTESLEAYLNKFNFTEFLEQSGEDDPEIFRESLLSSMIRIDSSESLTLAEVINKSTMTKDCPYQKILKRYGIKSGVGCFFVKRTSNKNFQNIFKDSKWKNNWHIALTRIKGSNNNDNKPIWINGKASKVIRIPFDRWTSDKDD